MTLLRRACPVFAVIVAMALAGAQSATVIANAPGALAGPECCAAGAHPGAMCPLHGKRHVPAGTTPADASTCRLSCAASANSAMLLPAMPLPAVTWPAPVIVARAPIRVFGPAVFDIDLPTVSPPPRT